MRERRDKTKLILRNGIGEPFPGGEEQRKAFFKSLWSLAPDGVCDANRKDSNLISLIEQTPNTDKMGYIVVEIPEDCYYVVERDNEYDEEWIYYSETKINRVP